ncbi:glycosyltransferase family 2 protein [Thermodesulfobium narugense]|nr:glycosyltransferase [Thermodesulfobium narugense]
MPTFNRKDVVTRAINSVLKQTYSNIEFIIIDDFSEDGTEDLIRNFITNNKNIIYLKNKSNKGPSISRNIGVEVAKGDFITFIDDDIEYLPQKVEKTINLFMLSNEDDFVIYTNFYKIKNNEKKLFLPLNVRKEGCIYKNLLKGNFVDTSGLTIPRTCLLKPLFAENLRMLEDWELALKLSQKYKFKYINEPLYYYYDSPNSINKQTGIYSIQALSYITDSYGKDMTNKTLSQLYYILGKQYAWISNKALSKEYIILAIKKHKLKIEYWIFLLMVIVFSPEVLNRIRSIKKFFSSFWYSYIHIRFRKIFIKVK